MGAPRFTTAEAMMTIAEVAATLAVSDRTVARMCARGDLPAYKISRQWRINRSDFLRWLRKSKSGSWRQFTSVETPTGSGFSGAAKKSENRLERLLKQRPESISRNSKSSTAD